MSQPEGPEDSGAFGNLTADQVADLEDTGFHLHRQLIERRRAVDDWCYSFFCQVHRDMFEQAFPHFAGRERRVHVALRHYRVPRPEQIVYHLKDLEYAARRLIERAERIKDSELKVDELMPALARFHADCVIAQPFIDGNKRWAVFILSALMVDCGFPSGTAFAVRTVEGHAAYLRAIDSAVADQPDLEPLANLILRGWLVMRNLLTPADEK
jgi:fido (protein-threonine AMPylation protein)